MNLRKDLVKRCDDICDNINEEKMAGFSVNLKMIPGFLKTRNLPTTAGTRDLKKKHGLHLKAENKKLVTANLNRYPI